MIARQTRRASAPRAAGIGVDAQGGPVIDPTENVLALVDAEAKFQNGMRQAESRYQDAMRVAEARRVDDMEAQRVRFETQMSTVLNTQVKTTSDLISAQLEKTTTNLGSLITTATTALTERISQLEQFRYAAGGMALQRGEARQTVGVFWGGAGVVSGIIIAIVTVILSHGQQVNPTIGADTQRVTDLITQETAARAATDARIDALSQRLNTLVTPAVPAKQP
jgi:hypothetical protein